jgi:DNA-binding MarR family transcriptional regulator
VISTIANRISRGGSRIYLQLFGIGVIEWRILHVLAEDPGATAQSVCNRIDLDKAAASRSLQVLEQRGYVAAAAHPNDARKRTLSLTPAGRALHERVLPISNQREQHLLRGFSDSEREMLLGLLRRMYANAAEMDNREETVPEPQPARRRGDGARAAALSTSGTPQPSRSAPPRTARGRRAAARAATPASAPASRKATNTAAPAAAAAR